MKEKWEELTEVLQEEEIVSRLDLVLALLVALLSGVIIGFLTCPKRQKLSFMGSCNGNTYNEFEETEEDALEEEGEEK